MEEKLNISQLIEQLIECQKRITPMLDYNIDEIHNDSDILDYFSKIKMNLLFINSSIAKKVADYCQLLNEEKNFKEVSLEQIQEIYKGLIKIHPLDIGFYESFAFYLNNVQDQPEEARLILGSGISIIEEKINKLKKEIKKMK